MEPDSDNVEDGNTTPALRNGGDRSGLETREMVSIKLSPSPDEGTRDEMSLMIKERGSKVIRSQSLGSMRDRQMGMNIDENFVIGRRQSSLTNIHERESSHRHIIIAEVAPSNSAIITESETSDDWKMSVKVFSDKKSGKVMDNKKVSKRIKCYYKQQDALIEAYEDIQLEDSDELVLRLEEDAALMIKAERLAKLSFFCNLLDDANELVLRNEEDDALMIKAERLAKLSFFCDLVLLIAKTIAVAMSSSISIISSLVDSAVDLLSGIIIWWTSRAMKNRNIYEYPSGRSRLEPTAIVILSVIMSIASFQLIVESVQRIAAFTSNDGTIPTVDFAVIAITVGTIITKFVLAVLCYYFARNSSSVMALAQDHRNDVLSNIVAIICGYLGSVEFKDEVNQYEVVYIDPIGAIIISIYILVNWWRTGYEQTKLLTGHTADPEFLSKITWICLNHHSEIIYIDTVRAFHFGNNYLVECDIVLPENMSLKEAHNIGETLQQKLEKFSNVERAFVHLDYETEHHPHDEHKPV